MAQDKVFTQGVESALDVIGELKAFLNTLLAYQQEASGGFGRKPCLWYMRADMHAA
jgi:hypothetical protein